MTKHPHIAVVGGGYAGCMALVRIRRRLPQARITLVDPRERFEQRVEVHREAAGLSVRHPSLSSVCHRLAVEHRKAWLEQVEGRALELSDGRLEPDGVVLALGSQVKDPPPSEGLVHTVDDSASAQALHAALCRRPDSKVVVIGSGATGIEVATEVAARFRHARVELIAGEGALLDDPASEAVLLARMKRLRILVTRGARVIRVRTGYVDTTQGDIASELTVWCGGFEPRRVPGLPAGGADGRLITDDTLRVREGLFVAGDMAVPEHPHRMGCVSAMPMGAIAGENVARELLGEPLRELRFKDISGFTSTGGIHGVAQRVTESGERKLLASGLLGGTMKRGICLGVRSLFAIEQRLVQPLYRWPHGSHTTRRLPA